MAQTNQRAAYNNWIKPLTFATPFIEGESITSWLIRAAMNSGCQPLTLTSYYWSNIRMWSLDVDKGFNHIDPHIHEDMAVLARTSRLVFDTHNLMNFADNVDRADDKQVVLPWVLPLSKRNRYARYGYAFCPVCLHEDSEPYLRLGWRLSWMTGCSKHHVPLQSCCPHCQRLFQPQFAKPENRRLDVCVYCDKTVFNDATSSTYDKPNLQTQVLAEHVWQSGQGHLFEQSLTDKQWFAVLIFFINIVRRGLTKPDYMFGKLLSMFGIDTSLVSVPKTKLRFDNLPQDERAMLLEAVYPLLNATSEQWLSVCQTLNATQNSFHLDKTTLIPDAFMPVYQKLSINTRQTQGRKKVKPKVKSEDDVMTMWHMLERKMEAENEYERHKSSFAESQL